MDVTFQESEPFYGEKTDISMLFEELDQQKNNEVGQEGEKSIVARPEQHAPQHAPQPIVASVPISVAATPSNVLVEPLSMLNHLSYNLKTYKGGGTTYWCIRDDLEGEYNRSNR